MLKRRRTALALLLGALWFEVGCHSAKVPLVIVYSGDGQASIEPCG